MSLITCKDVALGYDGQVITQEINFEVNQGDYLCIVGENGAGKSTLIKALLHLKNPISGTVFIGDGLELDKVGYLPQQTIVQKDFPASVYEIVISGMLNRCGIRPFYNSVERKIAKDNMQKLGIWDIRKHCYRELSGGQQQRVLLTRALCATKQIILLDEPVAGLDPIVTKQMYELIANLNKEGVSIIMISHDINAAIKYSSHILHIGKKQIFFGKTRDYLDTIEGKIYGGENIE